MTILGFRAAREKKKVCDAESRRRLKLLLYAGSCACLWYKNSIHTSPLGYTYPSSLMHHIRHSRLLEMTSILEVDRDLIFSLTSLCADNRCLSQIEPAFNMRRIGCLVAISSSRELFMFPMTLAGIIMS